MLWRKQKVNLILKYVLGDKSNHVQDSWLWQADTIYSNSESERGKEINQRKTDKSN